MQKMTLGARMKQYEACFNQILLPNSVFVVRLDGRGFSRYTRKMKFKKPFDTLLIKVMQRVTKTLMEENQAIIGYTQSDEITLVFKPEQMFFAGRIQKITSILAAQASVLFNQYITEEFTKANELERIKQSISLIPTFDCRVFSVPTRREALNALLWREQDAVKNSINVLAQSLFSHKELQNLNGKELQYKMFTEKGVNWNELPISQKRGSYFLKKNIIIRPYDVLQTIENLKEQPDNQDYKNAIQLKDKYLNKIPEHILNNFKETDVIERHLIEEDTSFLSILELMTHNDQPFLDKYFGFI